MIIRNTEAMEINSDGFIWKYSLIIKDKPDMPPTTILFGAKKRLKAKELINNPHSMIKNLLV